MIFKLWVEQPKTPKGNGIFKLFDYLSQNKQIVLLVINQHSELKNIMTRLTSRFEVGLTVDIQVPDLEHRIRNFKEN